MGLNTTRFYELIHRNYYEEAKLNKKERTCLRCQKKFLSNGNYNRICGPCQKINSEFSTAKIINFTDIPEETFHYV